MLAIFFIEPLLHNEILPGIKYKKVRKKEIGIGNSKILYAILSRYLR